MMPSMRELFVKLKTSLVEANSTIPMQSCAEAAAVGGKKKAPQLVGSFHTTTGGRIVASRSHGFRTYDNDDIAFHRAPRRRPSIPDFAA
ncbi:hypothetical protein RI367_003265 [Sorochytrium milnesiophthora]